MPKIGVSFNEGRTDVFAGARADHNDWRERSDRAPAARRHHPLAVAPPHRQIRLQHRLPAAERGLFEVRRQVLPLSVEDDRETSTSSIDPSECGRTTVQLTLAGAQGNYLVGTVFYMTVDNFISWETKLDLGYRNMGAAYSYRGRARGPVPR